MRQTQNSSSKTFIQSQEAFLKTKQIDYFSIQTNQSFKNTCIFWIIMIMQVLCLHSSSDQLQI
ncbi:unnamed protein product [Paramecium sonneborni]|uniref:Uncharacterized protein n=1 Tax=Paramecium sonneborni TaxID=65129 RepID=A0A8S1LFS6_9CILI|nr:unnamed protein product [Paramecium sonneborni]